MKFLERAHHCFFPRGECTVRMGSKAIIPLSCYCTIFDACPPCHKTLRLYASGCIGLPDSALRNPDLQTALAKLSQVSVPTAALRPMLGTLGSLTLTIANLLVLVFVEEAPGWVCMMTCNSDLLVTTCLLHYVINGDRARSQSASGDTKPDSSFEKTIFKDLQAPSADKSETLGAIPCLL